MLVPEQLPGDRLEAGDQFVRFEVEIHAYGRARYAPEPIERAVGLRRFAGRHLAREVRGLLSHEREAALKPDRG
ncbi:MAG TPA: hypothetical protein PJ994_03450 [Tepidiformaceae bacterium]|nr:hypothetical protein [Tepidiformaceae bacterium]